MRRSSTPHATCRSCRASGSSSGVVASVRPRARAIATRRSSHTWRSAQKPKYARLSMVRPAPCGSSG